MRTDVLNHRFLDIPFSSILLSFAIHLMIPLSILTVKGLDSLGIHLFPKKTVIKDAYQSFIQVDVVALPDQAINEKFDFDPTLSPVENVKTESDETTPDKPDDTLQLKEEAEEKAAKQKATEEMAMKKRKEEEKKRLADQEKALKKLQAEAKREQALKALQDKSGKKGRQKVGGNILSQGTSTKGMIGTASDRYTALLTESIKKHFNIYLWQSKKNLEASVEFELFPTGRIRKRKIAKSSGDSSYDSAILKALDDSQPLPLPDDPLLIEQEYHITFRP